METRNHFYAWLWTRGVCTDAETGRPIGHLHLFSSKAARDQWVREAGHIPRSSSGYREAVSATWKKHDADPVVHDA